MNKKFQIALHIFVDFITAFLAWGYFYIFRKVYVEIQSVYPSDLFGNPNFIIGLVFVPLFWVAMYALWGNYSNIFRRSRLKEFLQFLLIAAIGVVILFFIVLIDDKIFSYKTYYKSILALYCIHFIFSYPARLALSTNIVKKIHNRVIGFNTLMIGSNQNALNLYSEIENQPVSYGNIFVGFLHIENKNGKGHLLKESLPHLGELSDLKNIINTYKIEEVIIAIESWEHAYLKRILDELQEHELIVKIIPDMYDILAGSVKMNAIFGAPLIEIPNHVLPPWQQVSKRALDIIISLIAIIVLLPIYIITAIIVKSTSKGPVLYSHERIGLHGKPFTMFKFRSMYSDAEKNGPALSSKDDPRITPFGKIMRKTRLDETPQFFNVIKGDMSLVGPRPERQFFINKIIESAPHYKQLHKIKPGITSWGQVKYGYAENVEQMIERLRYDLLYLENMSLLVDIKILIYTVLIVIQGRGK